MIPNSMKPASTIRLTDDNGRGFHNPCGARAVSDDGRLLWVGPLLPHQHGEFFLDGANLGSITLEQAMSRKDSLAFPAIRESLEASIN